MTEPEPLTPEEIERSRLAHERPGFLSVHTVDRWLATIDAKDDEIWRLSQELKAAREETVPLISHNAWLRERLPEWAERTHAAEAEVQRLREQLQRIADPDEITPPRLIAYNALLAAAALTEPEETNG